jgi:hypothetical protein
MAVEPATPWFAQPVPSPATLALISLAPAMAWAQLMVSAARNVPPPALRTSSLLMLVMELALPQLPHVYKSLLPPNATMTPAVLSAKQPVLFNSALQTRGMIE